MRVLDTDGLILKAGAIVEKEGKILLLFREKWQNWTFPKGHLEAGETVKEALLREVKEETGLEIEVTKELPDIIYEYPEGDGTVRVKMFLAKPIGGSLKLEYKGDKLSWVDIKDAIGKLSYENNKELIEKVRGIFE